MIATTPPGPLSRPANRSPSLRAVRTSVAVLAFAAAVGLTGCRAVKDFTVPGSYDSALDGMKDFRDAVYYPVVAFLEGISPYHAGYREFHPEHCEFPGFTPLTLLIHSPLGLLPLRAAALAYYSLSVVLMAVLAVLVLRCSGLPVRADTTFGLAALLVLSRPGHIDLYLGQLALPMALGTLLTLHFSKEKPWVAGLGLALVSIKPNFGVPLALLMLCRRDYRAVLIGTALGSLGALIGVAVLAVSYGNVGEFFRILIADYASVESQPAIGFLLATSGRIDVCSLAYRVLGGPPGSGLKIFLSLGCLAVGCAGVLALRRRTDQRRADSLSGVLICLTVLTCVYHPIYDALLLVIPLVAIAAARTDPWRRLPAAWRYGLVTLLATPAVNYVATSAAVERIGLPGIPWQAIMSINACVLLIALAACAWLSLEKGDILLFRRCTPACPLSDE